MGKTIHEIRLCASCGHFQVLQTDGAWGTFWQRKSLLYDLATKSPCTIISHGDEVLCQTCRQNGLTAALSSVALAAEFGDQEADGSTTTTT